MDLRLTGTVALVSGGSRGIGLAVARALLAEGCHVAIAARTRSGLTDALAELSAIAGPGQRVIAVETDTRDDASVRALVAAVVDQLGGVDVAVNCAAEPGGATGPAGLADLVDADLQREIDTKVLGYLRVARAVAPHMIARGWGRIINVSGLAARSTGSTFGSIRNVAVAAMTKNLADELGPAGINVTVVHPALTVTERTPAMVDRLAQARGISAEAAEAMLAADVVIGRSVTAAEVADVIAFLASPRSVAVTGDAIAVGGGKKGEIHY